MMITVFTATYNRADTLFRAYQSLENQTLHNFEWIIVDDGSTDETEALVKTFNTGKFKIHYFKQENKGKHFAINKGVSVAKGDLFFVLDSDDYLPNNALELVVKNLETTINKESFGGVVGRKSYFDNKMVGSINSFETIVSNAIDIRYVHKIEGDLTEVHYTKVLKEFPFPEIKNEKFCPEALVWNRIAQKYQMLYFNESIYNCEYLPDGLTSKIVKIRRESPIATMLCYSELATYKIPLLQKLKAIINFWRFAFCCKTIYFSKKLNMVSYLASIFLIPIGLFFYFNDSKNIK